MTYISIAWRRAKLNCEYNDDDIGKLVSPMMSGLRLR